MAKELQPIKEQDKLTDKSIMKALAKENIPGLREKMRIGIFSWESLNSIKVGGIAVHVTELAKSLAESGHEVHVFTRKGEWWQSDHEEIDGVFEHRVVFNSDLDFIQYMDNMCDAMAGCFHFVEQKYGKFDILHGHDWHVVNALTNIKYSKGYNFLITFHSTDFGRNGNNYSDSWFSKRISHREWLGGYESSKVITVSRAMKYELMDQYQIPYDKIEVIYNGVSPKKFDEVIDAGKVKERYGINPLCPVVLFVGRMVYQKGPDLLVKAIPSVLSEYNAHFIFVGSGDMEDSVKRRIGELGVQNKVSILGHVPDDKLIKLFLMCDIVCIPSRNEPFGIIALEAWSAGKPVVASDVGGLHEIVENFKTGIKAYYESPESIAWGIKYLIGNSEAVKKMGENCREEVKKFDWKEIVKKTLEVYREMKKEGSAKELREEPVEELREESAEKLREEPVEETTEKIEKEPEEVISWDKNKNLILEQVPLAILIEAAKACGIDTEKTWPKYKIIDNLRELEGLTPEVILGVLSKRTETPSIKKIKEELLKCIYN